MSEQPNGVSRRELLKLGGVAAANLIVLPPLLDTLLAHAGGEAITRGFWESLETNTQSQDPEVLRLDLEKKYKIVLLRGEINEFSERFQIPPREARKFRVRVDWPAPQLVVLDMALSILPPHFYAPRLSLDGVRPLKIALVDTKTRSTATENEGQGSLDGDIQFELDNLRATVFERRDAIKVIAHELVHIVSTKPFFTEREDTLKKNIGLDDLASLRDAFASLITEYEKTNISYERRLLNWKEHIGYGANNFHEFWSVATEFYLDGREEFIKAYSKFISQERANNLYEGMKEGIFQGWEYH